MRKKHFLIAASLCISAPLLLLIAAGMIAAVVCTVLGPLLELLSALPQ